MPLLYKSGFTLLVPGFNKTGTLKSKFALILFEKESCRCRIAYMVLANTIFETTSSQDKRKRGRSNETSHSDARANTTRDISEDKEYNNSREDDRILEPESSDSDGRITYVEEHRTLYKRGNILGHTA